MIAEWTLTVLFFAVPMHHIQHHNDGGAMYVTHHNPKPYYTLRLNVDTKEICQYNADAVKRIIATPGVFVVANCEGVK